MSMTFDCLEEDNSQEWKKVNSLQSLFQSHEIIWPKPVSYLLNNSKSLSRTFVSFF